MKRIHYHNHALSSQVIIDKLKLCSNGWMRLVRRKIMVGGTEKPRNMDFMGTGFESHRIARLPGG